MVDCPQPAPGLVIRHACLWKREEDAGQIEGRKHRPCAIVVCVQRKHDELIVTVARITRRRPEAPELAIELSAVVFEGLKKKILGAGAAATVVTGSD